MSDGWTWKAWNEVLDGLPERVEQLRHANALTFKEMSNQMGVSVGALHAFTSKSGECTLRTLRRIVDWVENCED